VVDDGTGVMVEEGDGVLWRIMDDGEDEDEHVDGLLIAVGIDVFGKTNASAPRTTTPAVLLLLLDIKEQ